ncbi:integrase, catalytic region, zinc finger, CCHC-type containing protein [Tanacetum coccineum]
MFTSTDGESIESYYHRFSKLMNDFKRNKHFLEKIASNLKFRNNLQPEWSRHVTIVHQTKDLHTTDYTQLYNFLKYNQKEVDDLRAERIAKTQDPLALMAISNNPFNYLNGNGNVVAARPEGNANGNNVRPQRRNVVYLQTQLLIAQKEEVGIQLHAEEFDLMAAVADLDEIKEFNANCILMANLQHASTSGTQRDKAPVYDSDESAKVQLHDNCYNNEIFNMFTQEEQYTELLEPILEPYQVQQNDSNVISQVSSVEQGGGTIEQHFATVEETRAYHELLFHNLAVEVEKVNSVNRKMKETNAELTTKLARYKNQEKCFEISQEKYDKLERCYQQFVYQEQRLTKKINTLHLSSGKQITALNEEISNLNKQLSKKTSTVSSLQEETKRLKYEFKIREDKLLDKQIQLENKIKELDNILVKTVLLEKHDPHAMYDSEETLELAQESRLKIKQLNKEIKPANYTKINHLSRVFVSQIAKSREELYFLNSSKTANVSKSISIPNKEFSDDTTPIVARKFLNEVKSTIVTLQRVVKQKMTLDIHNWSSSVHQEIHKIVKDEIFLIVNQVDARVQNFKIKFLKEAAKFVRDFQSLAKEDDESLAKHKALKWEIELLLRVVVSQDIMSIVQNNSVVDTSNLQTELEHTLDSLPQKLKNENVESEFQVRNYEKENAHLKTAYKNLFDSINVTRAQTKLILDSLQNKLHDTIYENAKLRTQLFDKVFEQKDTIKGVDITTKTRRSQPRSNTKNDRVPFASKSSRIKNNEVEVEEHPRNLLLSKNTKHMSSECNNIKLAIRNDKSEIVCAMYQEVAFRRNPCFVRNLKGVDLLKENRTTNLYNINLHDMASGSPICLTAQATSTKSWLWHQWLSHLNFDTINDLARNNLVTGLPKFKYQKELFTILLDLPEDIYVAVDSYETAQEIWLHVQQMMKDSDIGIQEKKAKLLLSQNVGNQVVQDAVQNPGVQNVGNQNGIIVVPKITNQNGNGNVVAARAEGNANGNNGNQIRCYNCRGLGHLARNCTVRPRRRDVVYLQTQLLIAQKEEPGIQLHAEEFDLMAAAANLDEIKEFNANCILMANLQQSSTSGTQRDKAPVYDSDGSAEVQLHDNCYNNDIFNMFTQEEHVEQGGGTVEQHSATVEETPAYHESLFHNLAAEVEKVNSINRKMKETNVELTTKLARYKNQEKCFEISQEKYDKLERCYQQSVYQEQCLTKKINTLHLSSDKQITTLNEEISNLNKQLSNEKSTVSSLQEEKKRLKYEFKIREDKLLDKQIQLENKIKELDNILVKTGQSIQTMHMLSPKPDSFYHTEQKMALGYKNSFYLKQA